MIYTSNYAKTRSIDSSLLVGISRGMPKTFKGKQVIELAPATWEMIKMGNWEKFVPLFNAQLDKLNVHKYAQLLDGKYLLCWENLEEKTCHRTLVREWFIRNGYECEEWEKPKPTPYFSTPEGR